MKTKEPHAKRGKRRGGARTAELMSWDREFLWHPFTPMKPWCERKEIVVIERGEGEYLIDTEGRRYLDGVSSLWCNVHGHNVPELNEAVVEQLGRVAHSTLLGLGNVPSIELGRRLVELVRGCGMKLDRVFYSDNGSTAVEVACKMAYQYWRNQEGAGAGRRSRFLALDNAYHGDTLGAVSLGGISLFHRTFKGLCFPVDFAKVPRQEDEGRESLTQIERMLERRPGDYAGIVVEPLIQGAGGMLMHPPRFLRKLQRLARRHDTLLIADEVMTGFGRTGSMFACERERVSPDFLCLSKGLTAGYMPLGVTLTTRRVFQGFYVDPDAPARDGGSAGNEKTFFHGHTFTGHPLACSVALASLDLFEKRSVLGHVRELMPIMTEMLARAKIVPGSRYVRDVRQCGLIAAIDLTRPDGRPFPARHRVAAELCARLRAEPFRLLLRPLADTLVLMPPLAITRKNLGHLCESVLTGLGWIDAILREKGG